jgi:mevalonate kinase
MEFYSHGKVLLTAEYVVLEGVKALSLPTKKGQSLQVVYTQENTIQWQSYTDQNELWIDFVFDTNFNILGYAAKILRNHAELLNICRYLVTTFPLLVSGDCARNILRLRNKKLTQAVFDHLRSENPALIGTLFGQATGEHWFFPQVNIAHNDPREKPMFTSSLPKQSSN